MKKNNKTNYFKGYKINLKATNLIIALKRSRN